MPSKATSSRKTHIVRPLNPHGRCQSFVFVLVFGAPPTKMEQGWLLPSVPCRCWRFAEMEQPLPAEHNSKRMFLRLLMKSLSMSLKASMNAMPCCGRKSAEVSICRSLLCHARRLMSPKHPQTHCKLVHLGFGACMHLFFGKLSLCNGREHSFQFSSFWWIIITRQTLLVALRVKKGSLGFWSCLQRDVLVGCIILTAKSWFCFQRFIYIFQHSKTTRMRPKHAASLCTLVLELECTCSFASSACATGENDKPIFTLATWHRETEKVWKDLWSK